MILLRRKGEIIVATGSVVDKVPSSNNAAASCTNTPACLPNHFTFTAGNLPWRDSAPKMGKKLQPPMMHAVSALVALLLSFYIHLPQVAETRSTWQVDALYAGERSGSWTSILPVGVAACGQLRKSFGLRDKWAALRGPCGLRVGWYDSDAGGATTTKTWNKDMKVEAFIWAAMKLRTSSSQGRLACYDTSILQQRLTRARFQPSSAPYSCNIPLMDV